MDGNDQLSSYTTVVKTKEQKCILNEKTASSRKLELQTTTSTNEQYLTQCNTRHVALMAQSLSLHLQINCPSFFIDKTRIVLFPLLRSRPDGNV